MDEETTLLAHLAHRFRRQGEDTATDALAFILNKSEHSRDAFNNLIRDGYSDLTPIVKFQTQVPYEDGSRPDMNGYDKDGAKRLLVESKFWASLLQGQASGYLDQLEEEGSGLLLFIVPDKRIDTLWHEVQRQFKGDDGGSLLQVIVTGGRTRKAQVIGAQKRVMMVSWVSLLDRLIAPVPSESVTAQNIRQLRGFVQRQDDEAFLPIQLEELAPSIPRRMRSINGLIDAIVDGHGAKEGWLSTDRRHATAQREGYGRYFRSVGSDGKPVNGDFFLCVNFWLWATKADTPLWLWISSRVGANLSKLQSLGNPIVEHGNQGPFDVPIYLPTGEERQQVLEVAANKVKGILEVCCDSA